MIKQLCIATLMSMPFYITSMQTDMTEQQITKTIANLKINLVTVQLQNAKKGAPHTYNEEHLITRQLSQLLSQLNMVQLTNATHQDAAGKDLVSQVKNKSLLTTT